MAEGRRQLLARIYPTHGAALDAVLKYEGWLEAAADALQKTHPMGKVMGIGFMHVPLAVADVCEDLENARSGWRACRERSERQNLVIVHRDARIEGLRKSLEAFTKQLDRYMKAARAMRPLVASLGPGIPQCEVCGGASDGCEYEPDEEQSHLPNPHLLCATCGSVIIRESEGE